MNRRRILTISSALAMLSTTACLAGQVQGLVENIDPLTDTVTIKDPVSGSGQSVHVHHKVLDQLRIGSVVKATLHDGSDKADTVEVLSPK